MTDGNLSKFFEELRLGNPELQEPFDRYLQALATTVINIRMIFDSPIILGGYVGAYSEYFVDRLRQLVVQLDPYESSADYIYPCVYKKAASAVGAALFFVKKFIDTI